MTPYRLEIRRQALDMAIETDASKVWSTETLLARAEQFYEFLMKDDNGTSED